jgi:hypothetical protein
LDLNLFEKLNKKINLGIYTFGMKNGGRARLTSILINYLNNLKVFKIFLFTILSKQDKEYLIPKDIKRMAIKNNLNYLNKIISKSKIDILIYNLNNDREINYLNTKTIPKIIYYQHILFFICYIIIIHLFYHYIKNIKNQNI